MPNLATAQNDRLDKFLLNYARVIDDIDMYLSPASTLALWHNNHTIKNLGVVATILDIGVLKTPFVLLYVAKTRDYQSAVEWLGWETLSHVIPYEGGLLNIRRNYEKNVNEYYKHKSADKLRK